MAALNLVSRQTGILFEPFAADELFDGQKPACLVQNVDWQRAILLFAWPCLRVALYRS